jgi:hypothetical protein
MFLAASIFVFLCLIAGFVAGVYAERYRGIPLWQKEDRWSIGIYEGDSPFHLTPHRLASNPVLSAKDVNDVKADFVADPFLVREGPAWYMFFEVMDANSYNGKIALATSDDGLQWTYKHIVLEEPWHLSYPYVFKWGKCFYMVPESASANAVHLYRAANFPGEWKLERVLLYGRFADPSIFRHDGRWWLFAGGGARDNSRSEALHLFYADDLHGEWKEHPMSPVVVGSPSASRPGGRVLSWNGLLVRYTQDGVPTYGSRTRAFEITELSPTSYREQEVGHDPVIAASGTGWNANGMHHVDAQEMPDGKWIAGVDGNRKKLVFRVSY